MRKDISIPKYLVFCGACLLYYCAVYMGFNKMYEWGNTFIYKNPEK